MRMVAAVNQGEALKKFFNTHAHTITYLYKELQEPFVCVFVATAFSRLGINRIWLPIIY